jgi:thiopurine S-methyltransferase
MVDEWLDRWATGRIGWHEEDGNAGLKTHWRANEKFKRILVPLCGKSPDLVWLARRGHEVVGVELAEKAIHDFFAENNLAYRVESGETLDCYSADELPISIYCGDYFKLDAPPFDGLYDRGGLVAIPDSLRPAYIEHTKKLLLPDAVRLIITLEYDQTVVQGPPFSIMPSEIGAYWDDLHRVEEIDDLATCPPKFRAAGLKKIQEVIWLSGGVEDSR